ncbi:oligosaccharide flippase family protein [Pseudoponticoccus marisrubri]|uniref:Polysaccharide biosynthesis protein n=1 Tax=Pseudoponticoccus marisrubri TaxID=1685382 RepID=A0A0W7WQL4_9RHOB|nr:oligosaccharide flippase family protein [Pseudoponticoccus marisrubri]KUF12857.1 polysaccharide biosynthesis protein [Pseudoponticoccus marisrubri]
MAYGASELATKLSRLGVVVAVARTLDPVEIGLAAAALAAGDMLKSLTENGIGQRLIAAPADQLDAMCNRAHGLFWIWCVGLFVVQSALAGGLWMVTGNAALAALVLVLAGEYLFMPGGLVQTGLALRAGKLRRTAAIAGGQAVMANLMSVALALVWPSALALVLPRLLTAPFWLISMRRLHPWQPDPAAGKAPIRPFLAFGWPVLGVEIVKAARLQADKLIIGALLGPQVLGMYFMAFNAGLSLATSFSTAFAAVLFPHLCTSPDRAGALRQSMTVSLGLVAPAVIAQSLLAPWYVPLLLGSEWQDLSGVVSILCLAAIPTMLWTATAGWLRAENRPGRELAGTAALTTVLMAATALAAPFGLEALAWAYLATASLAMTLLSWPALRTACLPLAKV